MCFDGFAVFTYRLQGRGNSKRGLQGRVGMERLRVGVRGQSGRDEKDARSARVADSVWP